MHALNELIEICSINATAANAVISCLIAPVCTIPFAVCFAEYCYHNQNAITVILVKLRNQLVGRHAFQVATDGFLYSKVFVSLQKNTGVYIGNILYQPSFTDMVNRKYASLWNQLKTLLNFWVNYYPHPTIKR